MDNNQLTIQTAKELAARLSNAEIDRASFKAQAEYYLGKAQELQKQLDDLKAKLPKEDKQEPKDVTPDTKTDPDNK